MSGELSREAIEAVDPRGMLGDVLAQPQQLTDALWRVESAAIEASERPGGLVVCGMGGSAIGADLATAAIGARARAPLATVRDYALPPWVGAEALVLCASYSGDTEETLACFEAAGEIGAPRIALTTGGELAEAARAAGVPVIGIPSGMQPRAGVAYMTVAALECAALCSAGPDLRREIESASALLGALVDEWGPDAPDDSPAKALAGAITGGVPVFYGAGPTAPVARRWKTQQNENAKRPAFWAELSEANHNEIEGWPASGELGRFAAVFLESPDQHPRIARRVELMAEMTVAGASTSERIGAPGETPTERVLSLVLLGDLVSVYRAALEGTDPTPVDAIDGFKQKLG